VIKAFLDLGISNGIKDGIKELLNLLEEERWSVVCQFSEHQYLEHTLKWTFFCDLLTILVVNFRALRDFRCKKKKQNVLRMPSYIGYNMAAFISACISSPSVAECPRSS